MQFLEGAAVQLSRPNIECACVSRTVMIVMPQHVLYTLKYPLYKSWDLPDNLRVFLTNLRACEPLVGHLRSLAIRRLATARR